MDILQESALLPAEEYSVKAHGTERNIRQTPDRRHADALLRISEDSFVKDEDAYELSIELGREEAVQGWGRSHPLAGLFQIQKKSKRSKAADSDYHCLLCMDVKPLKCAESNHSTHSVFESERNCSSDTHHHWKGSKSPLLYLKMTERDRNVSTILNSFNVLPPVKAEGASDLGSPNLMKRTSNIALNQSTAHSIPDEGGSHDRSHDMLGAGERAGVEKICEFMKQAGMDSDVPEAHYGPIPPEHQGSSGLYWSSQPSKHLRFALGIHHSKKRDAPLNFAGDLFPRTGYRLVRNIKYEDLSRVSVKNSHGHKLYIALKSKSITETNSALPALFGTRVPLPVSSHRLL